MTGTRRRRGRLLRWGRTSAVLVAAVALTAVLAQHATTAAFTAQTADAGNRVSSAATFCTSPNSQTVVTGEDASTNGTGSNTGTNYGSGATMAVGTSIAGDGYGFIRFNLPNLPSGCTITAATLRLVAGTSQAATMEVYRATSAWSEAGITWVNQPLFTGSPVGLTVPGGSGPQSWSVTAHVTAMYSGSTPTYNYGFVVKDQLTMATTTRYQIYESFQSTTAGNVPTLSLTWG